MNGDRALILCAGTIPRASWRERIDAARAGGFDGVSLRVGDLARARAEGWSDADARRSLDDAGLHVSEIEALTAWRPGAAVGRKTPSEAEVFAVAVATGARAVTVVEGPGAPLALDTAAESFGGLCDRAAAHGLQVAVEFWPGSGLDFATAAAVVAAAARPNGGLLVDCWHLARTAGGETLLRELPGTIITAVQVSDSARVIAPEPDYLRVAMTERLMPGDGALDLVGFLRSLDASGSAAPIGVEICSDALAVSSARELAQRAGESVRAVVRAARTAVRSQGR